MESGRCLEKIPGEGEPAVPRAGLSASVAQTSLDPKRASTLKLASEQHAPHFPAMITMVVGTNRPGSNTRKVAAQIEEIYRELNTPLKILDLANLPQEIFHPRSYGEKPVSFHPFSEGVLQSSGLIVVTPEYNGSLPGVLKYFIDMLKFPESFERRPVCFVGLAAGMWGALRPVEQLQAIFGYRNAFVYPERVFLPKINDLLNDQGRLKDSELVDRLRAQQKGFIDFVGRLRA
jgi:chromate reductase, NAD(P)H dehydrogenase (quinone)